MAIQVSNIVNKVKNVGLDAEGTDYYDFDRDIKPALNAAVKWLIQVINSAYGRGKLGEEIFQEITFGRVFQTNQFSRVFFSTAALGHEVWTILSVNPTLTLIPSGATITSVAAAESLYRADVSIDKITGAGAPVRVALDICRAWMATPTLSPNWAELPGRPLMINLRPPVNPELVRREVGSPTA